MHDHVPPSSHIGPTVSQTIWQCATTEGIVALFMTAAAQLNAVECLFRRFISCCMPRSRLSCYPACPFLAPPCLFQHQCSTSFTSRPGLQVGTIDQRIGWVFSSRIVDTVRLYDINSRVKRRSSLGALVTPESVQVRYLGSMEGAEPSILK